MSEPRDNNSDDDDTEPSVPSELVQEHILRERARLAAAQISRTMRDNGILAPEGALGMVMLLKHMVSLRAVNVESFLAVLEVEMAIAKENAQTAHIASTATWDKTSILA